MDKTIIFVTSDIHSDTDALKAVIEAATEENASKLLIAGDLCPRRQYFFTTPLSVSSQ